MKNKKSPARFQLPAGRAASLLALALSFAGCATGLRSQGDEVKRFAPGGKQIRGPRFNLGNLLGIQLVTVDLNLETSVEEPAVVTGASVLSQTGLDSLNATVASERGGTNTLKRIGYDGKGFTTDVSTNAAGVLEAGGKAGGNLLNHATTGGK